MPKYKDPSLQRTVFTHLQGLVFMSLDIVEEVSGAFSIWGTTADSKSVLVKVEDFKPYLYIATPLKEVNS